MSRPLVTVDAAALRAMLRDRLHFGLLVGGLLGAGAMAALGYALTPPPAGYRTLPRPAFDVSPPPVFDVRGEDLIPPQALPIRPGD